MICQSQKPVIVLEKIHSNNKGETKLDCFMGSRSTGQAAINLNWSFSGFELDNSYLKKF
ncbi:DNA methyltransferase [Peribacillus sp. FSL M8-0224]|uniref:DNA methyltransferase n=1 Tax=Peribacillus sp. FSL M8-0224 TaxID=2921568 RepID=UPI004046D542|nr:site-specific DNA-methyltransferase [Brevibacterium sp. PAMC21349]